MQTGKCLNWPETLPIEPRVYGKKAKWNSSGHVFVVADPTADQFTADRPDAEPTRQAPVQRTSTTSSATYIAADDPASTAQCAAEPSQADT